MKFLSLFFCDFLTLPALQRVYRVGIFNSFLKNVSALWSVRFISVRSIETSLQEFDQENVPFRGLLSVLQRCPLYGVSVL